MVKKICPDCNQEFECVGRNHKCNKCQELYRQKYQKEYHKEYWKDKPASSHAYYQFYKFCTTLTADELRALFTIMKQKCKERGADILELRTMMKVIGDVCRIKEYEFQSHTEEEHEKDIEAQEIRKQGGYIDESDE